MPRQGRTSKILKWQMPSPEFFSQTEEFVPAFPYSVASSMGNALFKKQRTQKRCFCLMKTFETMEGPKRVEES